MIFNSLEFLLFLFVAFTLHWALFSRDSKWQNIFLFLASLFFYGYWDVKLLVLLLALGTFTFFMGKLIGQTDEEAPKRKVLFFGHILSCILVLCLFKYFNFFQSIYFRDNSSMPMGVLHLIFPLGLSFYTFSNLSYIFDIYRGKIAPTENWLHYNVYVAFFPKIVSGPIEKPGVFLPQLKKKRVFTYEMGVAGLKLIVFGFFKKVVVADSVSPFVNDIFTEPHKYSGPVLLLGAFLYAFQIYADFSGYSDIAQGVAGLFGITIMENFKFPFFSKNIGEFWRRWHISLSTWLNDYVFKPVAIALRNFGYVGIYAGIFITFLISGIWHGEGITFIIWGVLHAIYYAPLIYHNESFSGIVGGSGKVDRLRLSALPSILFTFVLVTFALIFFRADSMALATQYLAGIVHFSMHTKKSLLSSNTEFIQMAKGIFGICVLLFSDVLLYNGKKMSVMYYYFLFLAILFLGSYSNTLNFIYFKF